MINSTKQIVLEDNLTNEELLNLVIEQRKTIKSLQDKDEKNNNLFENSIDLLFKALHPGCRKKGRFSSIRVIRDNISPAVAPLLANIATVFSGWNTANHKR